MIDLSSIPTHPAIAAMLHAATGTVAISSTVPLDTTHALLSPTVDNPPSFWVAIPGSVWAWVRLVFTHHPITVIIWGHHPKRPADPMDR